MAVTVESVGPSAIGASQLLSVASPLTWNHTIGGANRFLLIGLSCGIQANAPHNLGSEDKDYLITSVLVGTQAAFLLSPQIHAGNLGVGYLALYGLVAPPVGVQPITVNYTIQNVKAPDVLVGGSVNCVGVDQFTPYGNLVWNTGLGVLSTLTIPSQANNLVVDLCQCGSALTNSTQTNQWLKNVNTNSGGGNAGQSTAPGAPSVLMSYNQTNDFWALLACDVHSVGSVPRNLLTMGVGKF